MSNEPYIILHGGFHKTATSHIQGVLNRNRNHLKKRGVNYVHHRHTRKGLTVPAMLNAYPRIGIRFKTVVRDDEMSELSRRFHEETHIESAPRTIISDENIAGHCGHCVKTGSLYRFRRELIETFARSLAPDVRELHLAIRSYDEFFAAAYVEYLRSVKSQNFIGADQMKQNVLEKMPSWEQVIDVFSAAFPEATLFVWKHEDFRTAEARIIGNLVGDTVDVSKLKSPKQKNKRQTASDRAVRELLRRIEAFGPKEAISEWKDIQAALPRTSTDNAFYPWNEAEAGHLRLTYERDARRILSRKDVNSVAA